MIDTARLLIDSLAHHVPPTVAELRRHLDSAYDARPVSAAAARRWLERLAASIAAAAIEIAHRYDAADVALVADETRMWIEALDVQCQAALDELTCSPRGSSCPISRRRSPSCRCCRRFPRCATSRT
jgi:hypothetical protein